MLSARRLTRAALTALLVVGAFATVLVAELSPASAEMGCPGATCATNDAELRQLVANTTTVTTIYLMNDINCAVMTNLAYQRNSTNLPLTIEGNGHTISAAGCLGPGAQVLFYGGTNGKLTLRNVTITGGAYTHACSAGGAGVQSNSDVVLDHATIRGNSMLSDGGNQGPGCAAGAGGLSATNNTVTMIASTISNNDTACTTGPHACSAAGGGVAALTLIAQRSTFSNNSAAAGGNLSFGGGASFKNSTLVDDTFAENGAVNGSNVYTSSNGVFTTYGSVFANPLGGANCFFAGGASTASNGSNYEQGSMGGTCGFGGADTVAGDPLLQPLANNGGATQTRMPTPSTSPLVAAIPPDECDDGGAANVVTDQRDMVRPFSVALGCTIGAVESNSGIAGVPGTFTSLPPTRILDTRNNIGLSGAFTPGATRDLIVSGGTTTVPSNGIEGVVLNVTATGPTAAGWLTLFPKGAALPTASNLNFSAGQTVPNLVVVKVGKASGDPEFSVSINNTGGNPAAGSVNVIGDVVGYYADTSHDTPSGHFTPIAPTRILDTRSNVGLTGAFAPNQHRALSVTAGATGVPLTASAVVMNATSTAPSANGWLTVSPTGAAFPNASNLNFLAGQTVPNLVVVKVGVGDQVDITNTDVPGPTRPASGTVHVIADVVGYFDTTISTAVLMPAQRILDTRTGTGGVTGPVGPNASITVDPRTASALPLPGSYKGVIVNVTATGPTQAGWLTAFPSDTSVPAASNLNFVAGQTVANLVQVGVGPDGKFKIGNTAFPAQTPPSGTVQVIVDIVGWYQ